MARGYSFQRVSWALFVVLQGLVVVAIVAVLAPTPLRALLLQADPRQPLTHAATEAPSRKWPALHVQKNTSTALYSQKNTSTAVHSQKNTSTALHSQKNTSTALHSQKNTSTALHSQKNTSTALLSQPNSSAVPSRPFLAQFPPANSSSLQVTVVLPGQLGNHMFQYASMLGIAHANHRRPFCPAQAGLHNTFFVTHVADRPQKDFKAVHERHHATYDPALEHLPEKNVRLFTYLQSWKYFHAIRDTIRQEFRFREAVKKRALELRQRYVSRTGGRRTVGVHVRRGDMAMASSARRGYYTAPPSYVATAMDLMRHKHGNVTFIVVSDDLSWCRANLPQASDYVIADRAPIKVHLALLASCDHVIMTVGTFGWWGGYLSGGDVVYYWDPKVCLHQPPFRVEITHPNDHFPPSWVPLPG